MTPTPERSPNATPIERQWPPFGLEIMCGPLALTPVRDDDLAELVEVVLCGVHDPGAVPFDTLWTTGTPKEVGRRFLQYHWSQRAAMAPECWNLEMAVRRDGEIVGCQGISTRDFTIMRTGETGSWLGRKHHGKGTGTLMRQVICAFMFDFMDAEQMTSAAFADNPASLAVSRKVGYQGNGAVRLKRRAGEMVLQEKLVLTPEYFNRPEHDLTVHGVAQLRSFLGLS